MTSPHTSDPYWVCDLHSRRRPLGQDTGYKRARNMCEILREASATRPDRAMFVRPDGSAISTAEFYDLARRVAKGLIARNARPGQGVCILGNNSVEWFATDWGSMLASCIPAPSYVTNSSLVVSHILQQSKAAVCFVDDDETLLKAIAAKSQTSDCATLSIVTWDNSFSASKFPDHMSHLFSFQDFLDAGDAVSDAELGHRMQLADVHSCAKLIYTSGTTGFPKGVMISHDNMLFMASSYIEEYSITKDDTLVSYLPASHIAANSLDCMGPVAAGITVHIADRGALRGTLVDTLRKVRPTIFFAVPRVWEKIQERMIAARVQLNPLLRAVSSWARRVGTAATIAEETGQSAPFGIGLAEMMVFSNVRKALGLDRARILISTAAPLQATTQDYFRSLRMKISQVYGMSETTGSLTSGNPEHYRFGSCGKVLRGVELQISKNSSSEEGELCFRGRNVFLGYLSNPQDSRQAIDTNGFLHSGDLGFLDQDGYLHVTGRAKDIIITAGGENVAPEIIERSLLAELPAIARACVVGDGRKYIACLLVPFMDDNDNLDGAAAEVSMTARTAVDAVRDEKWFAYINYGMERVNQTAISRVAKVKRFTLLPRDFSVLPQSGFEQGELTPTLKVRRNVVVSNFAAEIEAMYT